MSNFFKGLFFGILLITGFSACSTSEKISTTESDAMYPAWYSSTGFTSDSLAFHGFATAVSSDSVIAMANAELQARITLESHLAEKLESVRKGLEESGASIAADTDFIITLRNAHDMVQDAANSGNKSAQQAEGYYRGFAQVSISKTELKDLLESGFSGKSSYWQALNTSNAFAEEMR